MILRDIGFRFFTNTFTFSFGKKNSLENRRAILKISVEQIQGSIFNDVYINFLNLSLVLHNSVHFFTKI